MLVIWLGNDWQDLVSRVISVLYMSGLPMSICGMSSLYELYIPVAGKDRVFSSCELCEGLRVLGSLTPENRWPEIGHILRRMETHIPLS